MTIETLVADTRAHAARFDNEWDRRAVDWPLDETSVVVEVGGYTGRWALQIAERYAPRLYVFEPQGWAAEVCKAVLGEKALVSGSALGDRGGFAVMTKWGGDGCTLVHARDGWDTVDVPMFEIGEAFRNLGITHIDLMLMNIEGYEYTLIPHMLKQGVLPDRLIVQFHPQPEGDETMAIYSLLDAHGYRIAWDYGVVLTAWERATSGSDAGGDGAAEE